jgi:hypothetical protein
MIETCAFFWNFRENVNVLKNSLLKMSNFIFIDWKLTYIKTMLGSSSHPTTGYLDNRCYRELRSYLRHTEWQVGMGTQIISTSHGMTGRNFFDVFLPFYLLFGFYIYVWFVALQMRNVHTKYDSIKEIPTCHSMWRRYDLSSHSYLSFRVT